MPLSLAGKAYEAASQGETIPRQSHSASIHSMGVRASFSLTSSSAVKLGPRDAAEAGVVDDVVAVDPVGWLPRPEPCPEQWVEAVAVAEALLEPSVQLLDLSPGLRDEAIIK